MNVFRFLLQVNTINKYSVKYYRKKMKGRHLNNLVEFKSIFYFQHQSLGTLAKTVGTNVENNRGLVRGVDPKVCAALKNLIIQTSAMDAMEPLVVKQPGHCIAARTAMKTTKKRPLIADD